MIRVDGTPSDRVSARDRGLAYGDGVFRTLRCDGGEPRWWRDHYRVLAHDCAVLRLVCPEESRLAGEVRQAAEGRDCVVKIVVTRGPGERGYRYASNPGPTCVVLAADLPVYPDAWQHGARLRVCDLRLGHQPALAGIKHLNRLENVLARAEWDDDGIVEGLLLDGDGWVIGGTMSNVFARRGRWLFTPVLDQCGVAGVTRARVMGAAGGCDLAAVETRLSLEDLRASDEVFLTNSVFGIWRVAQIERHAWKDAGNTSTALRAAIGWPGERHV